MTKHRRRRTSTAAPRQRRRAPRRSRPPGGPLSEKKNTAVLTRELNEAREQQAATSEVLRVISNSPGDLKPVFETMLANAIRLCEAKFGSLFLREGEGFRNVCNIGERSDYTEWYQREPMMVLRDHHPRMPLARVAESKAVIDIPDLAAEQAYIERDPRMVALVEAAGARSLLGVPMLKENELVGAIAIYRQEVRPFTEKQIEGSRTSPPKPSSPSRTFACSMSCANRCSSRQQRRRCWASSHARPASLSQCSTRCCETRCVSVGLGMACCLSVREKKIGQSRCTA